MNKMNNFGIVSEIALNSSTSELNIFTGIEIHIELNFTFESIQLLLSLADTADNHDGGNYN